jgi:hypothetical protein
MVSPGGVALVDSSPGHKPPVGPAPSTGTEGSVQASDVPGAAVTPTIPNSVGGMGVAAWRTGPIPLVLAAVAGVAVVGMLSMGPLRTIGGLFSGTSTPAAPIAETAATATEVVVELDSRPRGAVVESLDGKPVGRTPVSLRLPRSKATATFTLKMSGYEPLRYEVVPERDQMATLELRPTSGL